MSFLEKWSKKKETTNEEKGWALPATYDMSPDELMMFNEGGLMMDINLRLDAPAKENMVLELMSKGKSVGYIRLVSFAEIAPDHGAKAADGYLYKVAFVKTEAPKAETR